MTSNEQNRDIGIDFIGFPCGSLGVGEQIRGIMRVAKASGYRINAIDCYEGEESFKNDDLEFSAYVSNQFQNKIRIYSGTHSHMVALLWRHGFDFFNGGINIFHLAWEFSSITQNFMPIIELSDQVWGISSFSAGAFNNNLNIPVGVLPNSIEMFPHLNLSRAHFSLPEAPFLFCISFDFNSFLSRKNPQLAIRAFREAFGDNNAVGLVVKVSNVNRQNQNWIDFASSFSMAKNIYLIDEVIDKGDLMSLFSICDAYISLHRSEGFGLGMAENMMLSKPVICTGYSGNLDFCDQSNSYLVDYTLEPVKDGEYPNSEGLVWASPSLSSAVEKIRSVYHDQDASRAVGEVAQKNIIENFSTKVIAEIFETKINKIIMKNIL